MSDLFERAHEGRGRDTLIDRVADSPHSDSPHTDTPNTDTPKNADRNATAGPASSDAIHSEHAAKSLASQRSTRALADQDHERRQGEQPAHPSVRPSERRQADRPLLLFQQVSKWYGPVTGINQVTLELRPGITGLVGPNGAGKSTLMRMAAGHLRPDLGRVLVCGIDGWTAEAKRHVGYCPDIDIFYEEMSGRAFIETIARLSGYTRRDARRRTEATLELVGMADRAQRPLAGYSKGMRQRIKLAQALIHDPEVLLLDEPLSGIDPIGRRESIQLFRRLASLGKCLLISSHELEELEKLTSHIAVMAAGRIAAVGTLAQIRDLLDQHPLSIRLASDRNRQLAVTLMDLEEVVGIDRDNSGGGNGDSNASANGDCDYLIVRVRHSRRFLQRLNDMVLEEDLEIRHLEPLDESANDVLGYLLGGVRS